MDWYTIMSVPVILGSGSHVLFGVFSVYKRHCFSLLFFLFLFLFIFLFIFREMSFFFLLPFTILLGRARLSHEMVGWSNQKILFLTLGLVGWRIYGGAGEDKMGYDGMG